MAEMLCTRCRRTIDELDDQALFWEGGGDTNENGYVEATCDGCLTRGDQTVIDNDYHEPYMDSDPQEATE